LSGDIPIWDPEGVEVGRGGKQRNLEEEKEKDSVPRSLCSFPGPSYFLTSNPNLPKETISASITKVRKKARIYPTQMKNEEKKGNALFSFSFPSTIPNGALARPKRAIPHVNLQSMDSTALQQHAAMAPLVHRTRQRLSTNAKRCTRAVVPLTLSVLEDHVRCEQ